MRFYRKHPAVTQLPQEIADQTDAIALVYGTNRKQVITHALTAWLKGFKQLEPEKWKQAEELLRKVNQRRHADRMVKAKRHLYLIKP